MGFLAMGLTTTTQNAASFSDNKRHIKLWHINQKGRKGAGVKGAGVANCHIFLRSAVPSVVVWGLFSLFPCVWGEEKVMTIYDAGPLAAGPLCGLLNKTLSGHLGHRSSRSGTRTKRFMFLVFREYHINL